VEHDIYHSAQDLRYLPPGFGFSLHYNENGRLPGAQTLSSCSNLLTPPTMT
jgi:hypothetical protein